MRNCCAPFTGKRITVLGLGLLGRGVGDVEFLARCGARVIATDKKTAEQLAESIKQLQKFENVEFHLGGHVLEDFTDCDVVVKAAGVPLDSPEIAAARAAGVPVVMSTALFAKYAAQAGATIVGITGTRGKSTVAHMIFHALKKAGRRAHLGGNVRGKSTLAMLPEIEADDVAVLELDSWQLQGFGGLEISPRISIFTNLMPDHMNYYGAVQTSGAKVRRTFAPEPSKPNERSEYGAAMETYFADKANIFKYQQEGDVLFVGASIAERVQAVYPGTEATVPPPVSADWVLRIAGEHNRENAALAAAALRSLGLSDEKIRNGLESFEAIEGRLQFVGEVNPFGRIRAGGARVYNDNNATTPEATIAALRAVGNPERRNVVLIVGGDDKNLDMSKLVDEIPKWCSKVVLFKERGTDRIRGDIFALSGQGIEVYEEDGMPATVARAVSVARGGETILYSPAFSSFGKYFKNEYDRGDQFMAAMRANGLHI